MKTLALALLLVACRLPADRPKLPATRERQHDSMCRQVCAICGFRYVGHRHDSKGRVQCECRDDIRPFGTGFAYRVTP